MKRFFAAALAICTVFSTGTVAFAHGHGGGNCGGYRTEQRAQQCPTPRANNKGNHCEAFRSKTANTGKRYAAAACTNDHKGLHNSSCGVCGLNINCTGYCAHN